jgi:predicted DNA-binding transcriptional regulator AlpA
MSGVSPIPPPGVSPIPPQGFTRPSEAAKFAGVSVPTLYRWAAQGRFPRPERLSRGASGIRNRDLLEWESDPRGWAARHQAAA